MANPNRGRKRMVPDTTAHRRKPRADRPLDQMDRSALDIEEVDFAELDDGTLLELIEDPKDLSRTLLAVCENRIVHQTDKFEHNGRTFLPLRREETFLKHIRLPSGTRPYGSVRSLLHRLIDLVHRCAQIPELYDVIVASFVLSTWIVDRLAVAPYLLVVGLPQSGKTTLMQVLRLVCRRAILTADISSAAFYRACVRFTPTLLIDETGTPGNNRFLRHLLRIGSTRDVVTMRKNQTFSAYGAKVISWPEPPDDPALMTRCILIPMSETRRSDLVNPTDTRIEKLAADLRMELLQLRFDIYNSVRPPIIPGVEALRPRVRDLLGCLAAACADDSKLCEMLHTLFKLQNIVAQQPLTPPQNAVLRALFKVVHDQPASGYWRHADVTSAVAVYLQEAGEGFPLHPRKVGTILTSLGFVYRERRKNGWILYLSRSDQKRIHELAERYGIDRPVPGCPVLPREDCALCRETDGNMKT